MTNSENEKLDKIINSLEDMRKGYVALCLLTQDLEKKVTAVEGQINGTVEMRKAMINYMEGEA